MIPQQLDGELNLIIHDDKDQVRSLLFSIAKQFYEKTLSEQIAWPSKDIKFKFAEIYEYLTKDRAALINLTIEEELLLDTDTSKIKSLALKIKEYDDSYLRTIIENRNIINIYVSN